MRKILFLILTLVACCFLFMNAYADPLDASGACCMGDGMYCIDGITEDSCVSALGGSWMGEESSCGEFNEETGWSGCVQGPATGACCLGDGMTCFDGISEDSCVNALGCTWMGAGTSCGEFNEGSGWSGCVQGPATGACCYDNGFSCTGGVDDGYCIEVLGGTYMGDGSNCGEFDEEFGWSGCAQGPSTGACCYDNGFSCTGDVDDGYCIEVLGGTYMGDGSNCGEFNEESGWSGCVQEPTTGACCYDEGFSCANDVEDWYCYEILGGTYKGDGSNCGEFDEGTGWSGCIVQEETGACCLNNGMVCTGDVDYGTCVETLGGTYMGNGSICGEFNEETGWSGCSGTTPTGACCMAEGMNCINDVTEDSCLSYPGGTWMAEGSGCGEFNEETGWSGCQPPPADGACCWYAGDYCVVTNQFNCEEGYFGVWIGPGTSCGEFNEETGWSGCEGAVFLGACCMDEGWNCVNGVTEDSCVNYLGGQWNGQDSDCGTYNEETGWTGCYIPRYGACCIDSNMSCIASLTQSVCSSIYGGTWMGEGTDCTDNNENEIADICEQPDTYDYLPGDANMSTGNWPPSVVGGDVTYLVNYFRDITAPCMLDGFYASADANGSCSVTGADVTKLVSYFRGMDDLNYCPDYPTIWPPIPDTAPDGWPNCASPVLSK